MLSTRGVGVVTDAAGSEGEAASGDTADVLVVGGGFAGCLAALAAAREQPEAAVELLVLDDSRFDRHSGTIDVLGYSPRADDTTGKGHGASPHPVGRPLDAIDTLPADHPYRQFGRDRLREALALFDRELDYRGGDSEDNALVVTHAGRVRPAARYPAGMAAGLASRDEPMRLVGIEQVPDLDAEFVADRLDRHLPYDVAGTTIEFPDTVTEYPAGPSLSRALDEDSLVNAAGSDDEATGDSDDEADGDSDDGDSRVTDTSVREQFIERVLPALDVESRVGFPAVLGEREHDAIRQELEDTTHARIFEVPVGPPSVPGRRLEAALHDALADAGVTVTDDTVEGFEAADGRIDRLSLAGGERAVESVVLATGGLAGPGLVADRAGIHERIFGCHVDHPDDRADWTASDFLGEQPFVRFGVAVDDDLRPLDANGRPEYDNLRAAGTVLGGIDYAGEGSADGVALVTGVAAGRWSLP